MILRYDYHKVIDLPMKLADRRYFSDNLLRHMSILSYLGSANVTDPRKTTNKSRKIDHSVRNEIMYGTRTPTERATGWEMTHHESVYAYRSD